MVNLFSLEDITQESYDFSRGRFKCVSIEEIKEVDGYNIKIEDKTNKEGFTITCNNCNGDNVELLNDYDYDDNMYECGRYLHCKDCDESEDI